MTASTNGQPGLARLRLATWWIMLGCLAVVIGILVDQSAVLRSVAIRSAVIIAALLVCAVAGRLFTVAIRGGPQPRAPMTALVAVSALAAGALVTLSRAVASGGFPWLLPLAALLCAAYSGTGWRLLWPAGTGLALGASLLGSALAGEPSPSTAGSDAAVVLLCAAALQAQIWVLRVAERLDRAHRLERTATITDERLRFAAELHDIQGHSLQVICLKSELAQRLVATDPGRAAAEMGEVQALARQALGDTREVVHGYRPVSLDTELSNAARVLAAAGIDASLSRSVDLPVLAQPVGHLLGLVVRECTTNVLRHSAARHCAVSLTVEGDTVLLRFANDGPLETPAGPPGGLDALAERLAVRGGRLVSHGTAEAFTVSAYLPAAGTR